MTVCGVNDDDTNIKLLNDIANKHENVTFAELLPFRKLCKTKYDDMGIEFPFDIYPETSQDVIERLKPGLDKFVF